MQRFAITILTLLLVLPPAMRADSRFAAPHMGLPVAPSDARSRAMGGVGAALSGEDFSFTNPARTVNFWRAGINGSMAQDYITLDDGSSEYDLRATSFLGLRGIFPSYYNFVVGWGIYQWRDLNWEYSDTVSVQFLEAPVARHVQSEGGLYVSRFSLARNIGDHLAVGFGLDWMFGKAERTRRIDFASGDFVDSRDAFNDHYSFIRPTLGLYGTFNGTNLGLSFTSSKSGDRDRELIYREGNAFSALLLEESSKLDFPMSWRLGVARRVGSYLTVASDLEFEGWSDSGYPLADPFTRADQWRWCLGAELIPQRGETVPWYRSFPVRAGYSRTTLGFELNGAAATEQVYSLGFGSYFGRNNGMINVALEFVKRELESPAYPTENVFRLTASLSLFEKWTRIPRRTRGED